MPYQHDSRSGVELNGASGHAAGVGVQDGITLPAQHLQRALTILPERQRPHKQLHAHPDRVVADQLLP